MKTKTMTFAMVCILMLSILPLAISPVLAADVTTTITVTKLANDGTTVLDQVTVTVAEMMAGTPDLPILGDGVTHYYFQGPTFDQENMWDQTELVNVDSRDYGACKGTDVKDLCEKLASGGASPGDEIRIKAIDGFYKDFAYEDVYNPEPEQGKLGISWYTADTADGITGDVTDGSYSTGMRSIFFAETTNPDGKYVFGAWDMHETLAEEYWHYYFDGTTMWPSSSGLSVKWVNQIIIYSSEDVPETADWPITLTGASTYTMDQAEFDAGVECHPETWFDVPGGAEFWRGIPLWRLVGCVDDAVHHGEGAFNDELAAAGYEVKVIGFDGYSTTLASADVARNDDMIVANSLDAEELPSEYYPLRLVGPGLTSGQKVGMIKEIQLVGLPEPENSDSLTATANVSLASVGIDVDRDNIDYGDVVAGRNSSVETVIITNTGNIECDVTMEVDSADVIAQDFYEQSLYIDGVLYDIDTVIARIAVEGLWFAETQLQVPASWTANLGTQEATFIFWAEAS
ncbi:MAG: hypothetical protein NWF03_00550 [Candidatus Bathyarchaeota archaeon]|nr:hypothetical protein [Candidatus Bathyarchaeota archaeon]